MPLRLTLQQIHSYFVLFMFFLGIFTGLALNNVVWIMILVLPFGAISTSCKCKCAWRGDGSIVEGWGLIKFWITSYWKLSKQNKAKRAYLSHSGMLAFQWNCLSTPRVWFIESLPISHAVLLCRQRTAPLSPWFSRFTTYSGTRLNDVGQKASYVTYLICRAFQEFFRIS
jgi:hypothetical protein